MKVLSIQQPWASLIAAGLKDVENRSWATPYRGKFLIHASSKKIPRSSMGDDFWDWLDELAENGIIEDFKDLPTSAIIGFVTLSDIVEDSNSNWAEPGNYHWELEDACFFDEPIEGIKGKLNLWNYDIDEDNLPHSYHIDWDAVVNEEE